MLDYLGGIYDSPIWGSQFQEEFDKRRASVKKAVAAKKTVKKSVEDGFVDKISSVPSSFGYAVTTGIAGGAAAVAEGIISGDLSTKNVARAAAAGVIAGLGQEILHTMRYNQEVKAYNKALEVEKNKKSKYLVSEIDQMESDVLQMQSLAKEGTHQKMFSKMKSEYGKKLESAYESAIMERRRFLV